MFCRWESEVFVAVKMIAKEDVEPDKIVDGHDGGSGLELLERSRWPALSRSLIDCGSRFVEGSRPRLQKLFYSA